MRNLTKMLPFLYAVIIAVTFTGFAYADFTYQTVVYPNANKTYLWGVDQTRILGGFKTKIVGYYTDKNNKAYAFLYDGSTYTTLSIGCQLGSYAYGISGTKIVGLCSNIYDSYSFIYDSSTNNILKMSGGYLPLGISGTNIVGYYRDKDNKCHGFLYNGSTYKTLDVPGEVHTLAYGISGTNIVGSYWVDAPKLPYGQQQRGFLYNGSTYKTLDVPGAVHTMPCGISGTNIVGSYSESESTLGIWLSFLYDGSTYTKLKKPGSNVTRAFGISGNQIVGDYDNGYGFIAVMPAQFVPVPLPLPK